MEQRQTCQRARWKNLHRKDNTQRGGICAKKSEVGIFSTELEEWRSFAVAKEIYQKSEKENYWKIFGG